MKNSPDIIVLAAGQSRRMAPLNKLLLPLNGATMIANTLKVVSQVNANEKIVVTGFQSEKLASLIDSRQFRKTHNPLFENGMTSSIQIGIKSLSKNSIGAMIIQADLPNLNSVVLQKLIDEFVLANQRNSKIIIAPTYKGVQKNPVIFSAYYFKQILNHSEKNGCKKILEDHYAEINFIEFEDSSFFEDIDTPTDYEIAKR
jgi:molybdenum cofactor cytidylyltransferase